MNREKAKKTKLFTKYLLLTLPFLLFSIVVTGVVLSWTNFRYFKKTIQTDYENIVRISTSEIRLFMQDSIDDLEALARILAAVKLSDWQRQIALSAFTHEHEEIVSVSWIGKDQLEEAARGMAEADLPADVRQLAQQAFSGNPKVSDVHFGTGIMPYVRMAAPVKILGEVRSILLAELDLKYVWDVLEGITIGETGQIVLMDRSGSLIGHKEIDRVLHPPSASNKERYREIQDADSHIIWIDRSEETAYLSIGSNMGGLQWVIVLRQPLPEIYQYLYQNLFWAFFVTITICLTAALTGWIGIQRILAPVEMLYRQALRIGNGDLDQKVAVITDDEIGELAQSFNDMTSKLKETIRREVQTAKDLAHARNLAVLGTTASKVTHEVGNLLNNTGMAVLALKREEGLGERGKKALSILERETDRVRAFIHRFLQFAKKPELNPTPVFLDRIVRDVADAIAPEAEKLGITIINEWPKNVPAIHADEKLLYQAFTNITKNSLEAIDPPGTIRFSGSMDNGYVKVNVADTGVGMAPELLEKIFDPFFTTKGKKGTGLGMSIVKTIVTAHRGTIICESAPGEGTRLSITLPLA